MQTHDYKLGYSKGYAAGQKNGRKAADAVTRYLTRKIAELEGHLRTKTIDTAIAARRDGYNQAIDDAVSICLEKSDSDSRDVDVMMQAAAISDCADAILALKKGGE
jgi:hypothetical protein